MRCEKPVEVRGGGSGATNIMEFFTVEVYNAGSFKGVAVVSGRNDIGGDKVAGLVLSGVSFGGASDVILEGV